MKNMFRVTRPAWATMDKSETAMIFIAGLLLAIYAGWGELIATHLLAPLDVPSEAIHRIWPLFDLVVVTFGCLALIKIYKKLRVGCYPSTFLYCFEMPEASNPSGRSQVVGYCHIKPNKETGEIKAEGESFFWENDRVDSDSAGFTSTSVRGLQDDSDNFCHIRFDINKEDWEKRYYRHGVLQFQLVADPMGAAIKDAYAGYLKSYRKDIELQDVEVRAKGYAEWHCKGPLNVKDIHSALEKKADMLLAKLDALSNATPTPTLWKENDRMNSNKANVWKNRIPTPQSVVLNPKLGPYINRYLSTVLAQFGLSEAAIKRFQSLVVQVARRERGDTLVAYERELKAGLIGQVAKKDEDEALTQRAAIIYEEIKPFLVGDSLLDIGCGNGLISNLARHHFKRTLLLDVVKYVPKGLNLDFLPYAEGHLLPTEEKFDTVLLLTVLHHSDDPVELLKLAYGATRKRLIVIESVVGIHKPLPGIKYDLVDLSDEDQIAYAAFIDWFYNRVLHDDVPVPYNFTTVDKWQSIFLQNGMRLTNTVHFGQDIDIGPEYHVLFSLDK